MSTSDIISISVLAMLFADVVVGVFLAIPYLKLKAKYEEVSAERTKMYVLADKYQKTSLDLLEKLQNQSEDLQRLSKDVETWKARSVS